MRMEDHFKDTLHKAVANEPPVIDAWDRFEGAVRRDRRWRLAASLAGATAVIAAAVIVVPQLGTDNTPVTPADPPTTSSPSPSSSPSVDPYAGWKSFENTSMHYRLKHPADWKMTQFEAVWEFTAPEMDFTDARGPDGSFGVIVNVDALFNDPPLASKPGAGPDERTTEVDTTTQEGNVLVIRYRIDWSPNRCITLGTPCAPGEDQVMVFTINGEDAPAFMGKYQEIGELIRASIEYLP